MCRYKFIGAHQKLFEVGDISDAIYFVMSGTLDVELTDGEDIYCRLDTLGPGSIIGMNFLLSEEPWYYRVRNNTIHTVSVCMITSSVLK